MTKETRLQCCKVIPMNLIKMLLQKFIEDFHVRFFRENDVICKILHDLEREYSDTDMRISRTWNGY